MNTARAPLLIRTLFAGIALSISSVALADGCRDGKGRLVYCDDAGRDTQNCIDKRGFTVSCGIPGARYKNSRAAQNTRVTVANRMAADVTVRTSMKTTPVATPEQDLVTASKRRAAAAKRGRMRTGPALRNAKAGDQPGT